MTGVIRDFRFDLRDPEQTEAAIVRLATWVLTRTQITLAGKSFRPVEVEVYLAGPGHDDPFAHRHPLQRTTGRWYFHRVGPGFRGGSFKGLDLTIGSEEYCAGLLLRGLKTVDCQRIDGPSRLVDHLLRLARRERVADLDAITKSYAVDDDAQPLRLESAPSQPVDILRTSRVGLSLRRVKPETSAAAFSFLMRRYRFLVEPERATTGRAQIILALHQQGLLDAEIASRLRSPRAGVARLIAGYAEGQHGLDPLHYCGKNLTTLDFARLQGWLDRSGS